jgi:uncharacterized protein
MSLDSMNTISEIDMTQLLSETALSALPVFPLPSCVLLPGGLMPLHIFEPRYRAMTHDALVSNQLIGVAQLEAGALGTVKMATTIGVGQIVSSEEMPDGRYMLLLRGIGRVTLQDELPLHHGYRRFRCQPLQDVHCPEGSEHRLHLEILTLCDSIALHLSQGGEQLKELAKCGNPGLCADALTAAIVTDSRERQQLLETASASSRLQVAREHLQRLLCELMPCDNTSIN